jgi:hypothetical protein
LPASASTHVNLSPGLLRGDGINATPSICPPLPCQPDCFLPRIHPAGHVSGRALLREERGRGTEPVPRHEQADGFASGGQHGVGNGGEARFRMLCKLPPVAESGSSVMVWVNAARF